MKDVGSLGKHNSAVSRFAGNPVSSTGAANPEVEGAVDSFTPVGGESPSETVVQAGNSSIRAEKSTPSATLESSPPAGGEGIQADGALPTDLSDVPSIIRDLSQHDGSYANLGIEAYFADAPPIIRDHSQHDGSHASLGIEAYFPDPPSIIRDHSQHDGSHASLGIEAYFADAPPIVRDHSQHDGSHAPLGREAYLGVKK